MLEHNLLYVENQIVMDTIHKRGVFSFPNNCITLCRKIFRQEGRNMYNYILYHIHIQDITIIREYIVQNHF